MWQGVWWMVMGYLFGKAMDSAGDIARTPYEGAGGGGGGGGFSESYNGGW